MIVVGTFMAVAAGIAIPVNTLLAGSVVDLYIAHSMSLSLTNTTSGTTTDYFCNATDTSTSARLAEFLDSSDPGSLLLSKTGVYSWCYVGLASGVLIASFLSTLFWNLSAYRQTRRLRQAFFQAIMKQEIGWFDVNPSSQLSSRLSE